MATRRRQQPKAKPRGNAPARPSRPAKKEYEEQPDWGTVFQRAENTPPQPQFTGVGVISAETLDEIAAADGNCQLAVWSLNRDGKPLRNRDGSRRFRIHIEPPYDENAIDPDGDDQDDDDYAGDPGRDDDIPF